MTASAAEHAHGPAAAWPADAQYGTATPGKIGMWIFLVSDAFSFGGLLIAYGILRAEQPGWIPAGEPLLGVSFTAGLTLLLILTSVTNVLAFSAAQDGRRREASLLLGLTALGGALFLVGQYQEWFGIVGSGLVHEGLVFGHSARATSRSSACTGASWTSSGSSSSRSST